MNTNMTDFFKTTDKKYEDSLLINMQLLAMPKEQMQVACQDYGLAPVKQYLDMRTSQTGDGNWNIRGFIRYLDTYLIEVSGGKRSELSKLGGELTGRKPRAFSLRLMRADIIQTFLASMA